MLDDLRHSASGRSPATGADGTGRWALNARRRKSGHGSGILTGCRRLGNSTDNLFREHLGKGSRQFIDAEGATYE